MKTNWLDRIAAAEQLAYARHMTCACMDRYVFWLGRDDRRAKAWLEHSKRLWALRRVVILENLP